LLGEFDLEGLIPAKKGTPDVEVVFNIDANGILQVSAQDRATKKSGSITINAERGKLSEDELKRMIEDAEKHAEQDKIWVEAKEARTEFENYVYSIKGAIDNMGEDDKRLSTGDKKRLSIKLEEAEQSLERKGDDSDENTKEKWNQKKEELQEFCDPFMSKLYGKKDGKKTRKDEL